MQSQSSEKQVRKTYRGGDTLTTKLTLAAGHVVPQTVLASFSRTEAPAGPYDPNRATSFGVLGTQIAAPPPGQPLVITLSGVVPHHIVGGTYKPTNVTFVVADSAPIVDANPDPDGDLVLTIADDPPTGESKPVIKDFDLA